MKASELIDLIALIDVAREMSREVKGMSSFLDCTLARLPEEPRRIAAQYLNQREAEHRQLAAHYTPAG